LSDLYASLSWLPRPPADFKAHCKAVASQDGQGAEDLRRLASFALDINKLTQLAKLIRPLLGQPNGLPGLGRFRLGLLSNGTTAFLADALLATTPRYGLALEVVVADFDQSFQEALQPSSALRSARLDAVLIALDYRALRLWSRFGDDAAAEAVVMDAVAQIRFLCAGFCTDGTTCIVQTIVPPSETLFGSLDHSVAGTTQQLVDEVNRRIRAEFRGSGSVVLDIAALAVTLGVAAWHDPMQWSLAKLPCAMAVVPLYADHIARLVGALRGQSRRALVLDLDNTLWGGVIGDDGLHGIVIGQGDPVGEAYLDMQRYALRLRDRGVLLAVSSKNDDPVARSAFREHPDMLLKEEHFAVFQANWSDKASNIKAIASALNLTLGSIVFVDDNPAERALVRSKLPEVAVPELPEDPAYYVQTISAAGYFDSIVFSTEDQDRARFYQQNARRLELETGSGDLDAYLTSLNMTIRFARFDQLSRARVAQLINKSNQFNLTTRRYSELAVAELEANASVFTLQVRLSDVFGDNGMISVVICREEGSSWTIDTWLMSCRVLRRKVENAVLREIVRNARARNIEFLYGSFIPSGRNSMVSDHFRNLGFERMVTGSTEDGDGTTHWRLALADAPKLELPFNVVIS